MPIDASVGELLNEISSSSPAPGGGSVAALSGCLGAALISMVCKLSIGRKKFKEVEDELKKVLIEAKILKKDLSDLYKGDIDAFNEVMAALKMTEGGDRAKCIQNAYKKATSVPLDVSRKCLRLIELAEIVAIKGNQNAITDSGVGALLAYSGLKGAGLNVKVNLKYIEEEDFITKKGDEMVELEKRGRVILENVMNKIELSIGRSIASKPS